MNQQKPSVQIRRQFHELAETTVAKRAEDCYREGLLDLESWREMADHGLWTLAVPEHLGGQGGSWWDFVAAFEGIATGGRDLGFNLSLVAQAGLIRSLMTYCDEEQLALLLPPLLQGKVGATALTETRGGSDVARIETAAERVGDGFRLTGAKDHVTHGPICDHALVLARVPELGSRDITLFMVDMSAPGVRQGEIEDMLGNRTSPTGPFRLDGVTVAAERVVGGLGNGLATIYDTISLDRLLYGVLAAAALEPVLEECLEFAHERVAFKHPIADYQYVQGRLTDIKLGIESTRWLSYAALQSLLADEPEAMLRCSAAKFHGAEALRSGAEDALRIFGHLGYMQGPHSRRFCDAFGSVIAGGTAEMQRKNIWNQMLAERGIAS